MLPISTQDIERFQPGQKDGAALNPKQRVYLLGTPSVWERAKLRQVMVGHGALQVSHSERTAQRRAVAETLPATHRDAALAVCDWYDKAVEALIASRAAPVVEGKPKKKDPRAVAFAEFTKANTAATTLDQQLVSVSPAYAELVARDIYYQEILALVLPQYVLRGIERDGKPDPVYVRDEAGLVAESTLRAIKADLASIAARINQRMELQEEDRKN